MARNFKTESEFGLPVLPDPEGNPIPEGATGLAAIPGLTDGDAIKAGAGGTDATPGLFTLGAELREIYSKDPGTLGPKTPKAGTSEI